MSTWLFIILFSTTDAQVIEVQTPQVCLELKAYVDGAVAKSATLKDKVISGCFKNLGKRNVEL